MLSPWMTIVGVASTVRCSQYLNHALMSKELKKQWKFCCVLGARTCAGRSCSPSEDDDDAGGGGARLVEARVLTRPQLLQKEKTT